ncbi:uncharacterized protein LOC121408128 isoform X1 [Lytechinus variegatus]|uniref:uncharacterized protein LOC121408128 isoform X1 n=1 Tax=Lytechinus variegatus TaxID=7654 RepID=UPI001BB1A031|nr:uncharacterized protein LOC121408128 isoform X1 [Lytechinus variegatus]
MAFSFLMFAYDPFLLSPKDSTQVESRLPTLQPRRSLLPGPKTHYPLRNTDIKPPHLIPSTPNVPFRHLVVGQRVETTDGRVGLLHFKGKTHFAQGCMCGIELDDPIGKHNGSVDGIHYFECPQGFGVFVPAHKVHNLPPPSPSSPTSTLSYNSSTSICSRESKDSKPSSRIPTLGLAGGKLPRPKTLPVCKDSNSKLKPNKKNSKNIDCGRSDTSSEKSSTSSKLFQSKKISPVHTNITHSGWTGDNRTKGKRTTDTQVNKLKPNHNTTFTVSDNKRQYARVTSPKDKPCRSSSTETSSKTLLQRKLARNKNVNSKLNSRPSLNDLTRTFEEGEADENRRDKPDIVEGCYSKLNETFELDKEVSSFFQESCSGSLGWDDSHSLSPLEDSSSGREKSDSSLAWDFEVPQSSTPVQIHLQVGSDIRTSIPEEPRIYPLGIGATAPAFPVDSLSSCDTENTDEEVEYNEFLAIPTFLDTPTGRYKFDLLTPEELEQALNEYNLLPEELQDAIEFEPQFSDVKPRIWEPITTVEDEFLRESSNALFSVPLTAMDPELKEKYEGIETPPVDSEATTPLGIASNGMEVDCYPQEVFNNDGKQREYPSVLPTPTSDEHTVCLEKYGEHVQSQGTLSDANDTTLVDNPSSMDDGVDLSEDFEMEVDPHNTTYDVDVDLLDQEDVETPTSSFVIQKCVEKRQEGDGQEVKVGMHFESNNNSQVPMSPVDLLEGTQHLKTCDVQVPIPKTDKFGAVIVSSGTDVEISQHNGTTSGRIVTSMPQKTCFPVTSSEVQHSKLERIMMDTEEDLKFRMDEMAVEANMADLDENKSVESECSRTESDRATDRRDTKTHTGQPNGELQAVMEVGMCLMSQNESSVTNGVRSGMKSPGQHSKEEEKKDEEKANGVPKRKSLLLTPKKVSKNITSSHSSHFQVTLSRPKTGAPPTSNTSSKPPPAQSQAEKDNKKTYTPSSWRNEKNGSTKTGVIPRRRSAENRQTSRLNDKNHPGRHSADATHLVQKLQPILDIKESRRAESSSSMEVDPGSITSSNRSMRSEVTASSTTSKMSSKNTQNGKPNNKTTLSLRNSSDTKRHERKPSSSSVTSDHSQRTESRTSISSRPSSNSSREARHARRNRATVGSNSSTRNVTSTKPPPSSTTSRNRQSGTTTSGRTTKSASKTSQDTTHVDAAPTRKIAVPSKKSSDHHSKKGSTNQKDPHQDKHGHKPKTTAHTLHASPPDLVYTSLVNGEASQEIKRLESLCETRFHQLSKAKEQLQDATKGFDAMATIVKYLSHEVDGFSAPYLKAKNEKLQKQVTMSTIKTAQQEAEICRLQEELNMETHTHEEEIRRTELLHMEEIRDLTETLRAKHSKDIQTMATEHTQEIRRLADGHQQEMCDMTASHQSLIHDIEDQHAEHVAQINQNHIDHIEEITREKDKEIETVKRDAEERIRELQDEIFKWKYQCDCQIKRTQELEEALRKDDDAKVQAAIAQYKHLPDEVASMKAVMEIKNQEIHDLRIGKMALQKEVDLIPDKDERIKNLTAKVEDVQALMQRKTEYERQLSTEHVHLRASYERESSVNKRLSMENEELMWRLNQGDNLSPPPRFKATSTPSPSPSPTGARKGFSRSSSTESHESGVFSPNHPH